ncbi:MAG: acetyl-coenzyme A synthetase, partial [Nitrospinota bacterium]
GQGLAAFVTLQGQNKRSDEFEKELREHVVKEIGAIARPDVLRFTEALPKTRSGKIMRRLLRDIASGKPELGDTTTLEDISVLQSLKEYEDEG